MTENDTATEARSGNRLRDAADTARERASDAYQAARDRTSAAYDSAREGATRARQRTSDGIDSNPVAALIGGLAIGGVIAALLPRTRKEEELLGGYGGRIKEGARDAARAAREAGVSKLDELGYNRAAVKEKLQAVREDISEVATAAAERARTRG